MKGLVAQNSLIKQAEAQIEQRLKAGVRESYMKIVISGMRYAMDKGPNSMLAKLKQSQDPKADVVKGAISLLHILRRGAKGQMPVDAMVPAGMTLVLQGLDFAERAGLLKIDKPMIAEVTHAYLDQVMASLGIDGNRMASMGQQVQSVMDNPEAARRLQQGVGNGA